MTQVRAAIHRDDRPFDPVKMFESVTLGYLTTEHAASSYGQPVFVGDDQDGGEVFGPAGCPGPVTVNLLGKRSTPEIDDLMSAARQAGFFVEIEAGTSPAEES